MRRPAILATLILPFACRSMSPPATTPAADTTGVVMRVAVSDRFFPASGDSAIRAFVPDVPATEAGGECRVMRPRGSRATYVSAYFPDFTTAKSAVSLVFDTAGALVRFSDSRGLVRFRGGAGLSVEALDSARRQAEAATRTTSISFDYPVDQAIAINRGGGKPTVAVIGSVRSMENVERLGPPSRRLQRARSLCGV